MSRAGGEQLSEVWVGRVSGTVMKNMNIVHISPTYIEHLVGGGERFPFELAKALGKYTNVSLVVFGSRKKTEQVSATVRIEQYPALTSPSPVVTRTNPLPLSPSFLKEINRADIVHIHQFNMLVTQFAILYAKLKRKPVCLTDHGGGILQRLKLASPVGKLVDLYLPVSHDSYNIDFAKYKREYQVIHAGVDTSTFRKYNDQPKDKVLFVGRIDSRKGIDNLVKAVQELNTRLYIAVGMDNTQKAARYLALLKELDKNNKAVFQFNLCDTELAALYNTAIVTVLPSVWVDCYGIYHRWPESFGLVLVESMACGTPVICTANRAMQEIVTDGETGFTIPPGDVASLKEKIQYFLDNPEEARRMGEKGKAEVHEKYTWDAVAKRCIDGYRKLISDKR